MGLCETGSSSWAYMDRTAPVESFTSSMAAMVDEDERDA
jgi:hypothetical protein